MDIKPCVKCGELFDIATNYDECPGCRYDLNGGELEEDGKKRTC